MTDLLHCPFCGIAANKFVPQEIPPLAIDSRPYDYGDPNKIMYWIECKSCLARGSVSYSKEEAIFVWNKRKKERWQHE